MLFMPKNFSCLKVSVVVDNHPVKEVHHTKFLGVIIDNKLKLKEHIDNISKKNAKSIGIIIKARKEKKITLLSLYNSLILPYLSYCIHILWNAYKTHLQKLHALQNKIARIIAGVPGRTSSDPLYCRALPPVQLVAVAFGGKRCSTSHISSSMHHMDMSARQWRCASKDKLTKYI